MVWNLSPLGLFVHARLICVFEAAVAVKAASGLGAVWSGVNALSWFFAALTFRAVSNTQMLYQ
jgi:hypothetical protein